MAELTPIDISLDIDINLINNSMDSIHCNQYENNERSINIHFKKNGETWNIQSGYNVELNVLKPSGKVIKELVNQYDSKTVIKNDVITLPINNKITVINGRSEVSFRFYKGSFDNPDQQFFTNVFYINVHKSSVSDNDIKDTTEFLQLEKYTNQAHQYAIESSQYADKSKEFAEYAKDVIDKSDYVKQAKAWTIGDDSVIEGSSANNSKYYSLLSQSYAVGNTKTRPNEEKDNAKYYYEKIESTEKKLENVFGYVRECTFEELPTTTQNVGDIFKVSNSFISTNRFVDGEGLPYPAGTCVVWISSGKWASLGGSATTFKYINKDDNIPKNINSGDTLFVEYE